MDSRGCRTSSGWGRGSKQFRRTQNVSIKTQRKYWLPETCCRSWTTRLLRLALLGGRYSLIRRSFLLACQRRGRAGLEAGTGNLEFGAWYLGFGRWAGPKLQIPNPQLQIPNVKLRAQNAKLKIPNPKMLNSKLKIQKSRCLHLGSGIAGPGHPEGGIWNLATVWDPNPKPQITNSKLQVSGP